MIRFRRAAILAVSILALAACDSAEERAEKHFQSGLELLEQGDLRRALVEFRNVFTLNKTHKGARLAYAEASREMGNIGEAYQSYLSLAEIDPNDMNVRLALTELAILSQNWDEAERGAAALREAATEVEGSEIPFLALEFRKSVTDKDQARMRELTREAEALAEAHPESEVLQRVLIEGYQQDGEFDKAIAVTDRAIAGSRPRQARSLYRVKAMLLARKEDYPALEAHLRETVEKYPDDTETKALLIQLLSQEGNTAGAEDFLRSEVEMTEDKVSAHVALITFLHQTKGDEAALAEIETALSLYEDARVLRALKAGVLFDAGQRDEAVTILEGVIEGAPDGEETDRYKITLARMLMATGNEVGARQLVEAVLAHDANQVEALKMTAQWQIDGDQADEAISTLRQALDQEPEDAEAMSLMARAYERNGEPELAQDLLALAVEASANAPDESLRYATVLMREKRYTAAENTVISALRLSPGNLPLLRMLGQIYLATEDWSRAEGVEATMRRVEGAAPKLAADELRLQIISRREGREQGVAFLEELAAASDDAGSAAKVSLIQSRLTENRGEEALALANELAEEMPDNPRVTMVLASTQLAVGEVEAAEATLRPLAEESDDPTIVLQFARILGAQGKIDPARQVIDDALDRIPDDADLLWAKASFLERENDIDGAIDIYERIYADHSDSLVVANNLASLLATYREDPESLERAYTVARRLRGTNVPPFQDTYGWILFRRGQIDEALSYLRPAAEALVSDPIVHYHLARAYEELGRTEEAMAAFTEALRIAGEDDQRPQIAETREKVGAQPTRP